MERSKQRMLFSVAVWIGAFLLFQVQPMAAKMITPLFGGSAMVWITCMVFFQTALLGGYLYAHVTSRFSCHRQAWIHLVLLGSSCLALQMMPAHKVGDPSSEPTLALIWMLTTTVGPAFLLLAATAPLLQRWYAVTYRQTPYRLYALSNVGSLLGLLSYPFLVEPVFFLRTQLLVWKGGLWLLVACFAGLIRFLPQTAIAVDDAGEALSSDAPRPLMTTYGAWLLLAAVPSMLLLAVTNQVSIEIAPIPLLWVVPLSLYLLTFIISFDHNRWYRARMTLVGAVISITVAGALLHQRSPHIFWLAGSLYAAMFCCSLLCHGELARLKPDAKWLTGYFLAISGGGVLGGLSVGVLAPRIFTSYLELPLAFAACVVLFVLIQVFDRDSPLERRLLGLAVALSGGVAIVMWLSPELHDLALVSLKVRQGSDMEFLVMIALIAFLFLLMLKGVGLWRVPATNSRERQPPGQSQFFESCLRGGLVMAGTLMASFACLFLAARGIGSTVLRQSTVLAGIGNPIVIWGVGYGLFAGWGNSLEWSFWRRQIPRIAGVVEALKAFIPRALLTASASALYAHSIIESVAASGTHRGLLLVPLGSLALASRRALRGVSPRARWLVSLSLLGVACLPALLLWRGILFRFGTWETIILDATLAGLSLVLAGSLVSTDLRGKMPARAGVVCGLLVGPPIACVNSSLVSGLFLPCSAALAGLLLAKQILPPVPQGRNLLWGATTVLLVGILCGTLAPPRHDGRLLAANRNFYSVLQVVDQEGFEPERVLLHGTVNHGSQLLNPARHREPTMYFHSKSGVGLLLGAPSGAPRKVGVIGLGVGTLAAYGRTGDRFRFFEIDPKVLSLAREHFDFLQTSQAQVDCVIADGRLALEAEQAEQFDMLIVDAFTGDAVPAHLLTAEAFELYLRRLMPGGFLAMNLSNTHVDLTPITNGHARRFRLQVKYVDYNQPGPYPRSLWAILSTGTIPVEATNSSDIISDRSTDWTDDCHALLPLIRFRH